MCSEIQISCGVQGVGGRLILFDTCGQGGNAQASLLDGAQVSAASSICCRP